MRVYLICPVRNVTAEVKRFSDEYVSKLEQEGIIVHYPPRDSNQIDDGVGLIVNEENRDALLKCDEIHVIWDPTSLGSHFDLGMAFMLMAFRKIPIVLASSVQRTFPKSYSNLLLAVGDRTELRSQACSTSHPERP